MHGQRLDRVRTAAGKEPAGGRQDRRDPPTIAPQDEHQDPHQWSRLRPRNQHRHRPPLGVVREPSNRRSAPSRSSPSAALLAPADAGNARTTTSTPAGSFANRDRIRCRSRRCTRWRITEPPTGRPTTKPTRGGTSTAVGRARCTTTAPQAARRPRRIAVAKSSRRVSRVPAGSNARYPQRRQIRLTTQYGPCDAGPKRWPDRRGYACATGTRGSSRGDGCSAGTYACPWPRLSFSWYLSSHVAGSQPSGLRVLRYVSLPVRATSPDNERSCVPGPRRPNQLRGPGAQEYPPVGRRRPDPRRPAPAPSKPASRVTVRATRRYIGGACLHRVLVAAPQAC